MSTTGAVDAPLTAELLVLRVPGVDDLHRDQPPRRRAPQVDDAHADHHTIDDGWDLCNRTNEGANLPITLEDNAAYANGRLSDGYDEDSNRGSGFNRAARACPSTTSYGATSPSTTTWTASRTTSTRAG